MWKLAPFLLLALLFPGGRRMVFAGLRGVAAVWRPTSGVLAVGALVGAAALAIREDWALAVVFAVAAAALALAARRRAARRRAASTSRMEAPAASGAMSARDARAILGVPEGADRTTVEAAYRRLIRRAHPDAGGTAGLAAQLNAARAALLRA